MYTVGDEALNSIIEHAQNLEKLDVSYTFIGLLDYTQLFAVKSLPKLKILWCEHFEQESIKIENIRKELPHLSVNPKKEFISDLDISMANVFFKTYD